MAHRVSEQAAADLDDQESTIDNSFSASLQMRKAGTQLGRIFASIELAEASGRAFRRSCVRLLQEFFCFR